MAHQHVGMFRSEPYACKNTYLHRIYFLYSTKAEMYGEETNKELKNKLH